jgi:glycerol-3-phosphate dehydrogenase (NAD(P)+)
VVWDHFPEVVEDIRQRRENRRFLAGIALHERIRAVASAVECVDGAALVVLGIPSRHAGSILEKVVPHLDGRACLLNVAKGFEPGSLRPMWHQLADLAPGHPCVQMGGPAIANEFARGIPASIVLASPDEGAARRVAEWFAGAWFMPIATTDVAGVSLGGILKNVYAILLGALEELDGGFRNLEAAALSAGMNEMAAIATACGGRAETIFGLAGLGDLIATCFSKDSHNREFGRRLASGQSAKEIESAVGWLPEGARAALAASEMAHEASLRAPLADLAVHWIEGGVPTMDSITTALRASVLIESVGCYCQDD